MHIYLIYRKDEVGYEEYYSAVVVAESEEDAKAMHPGGAQYQVDATGGHNYDGWVSQDQVYVELLGTACDHIKACVINASFRAG